jgi:hypothetical protein
MDFVQLWSDIRHSLKKFNNIREVGINQWYLVSFDVDCSYEYQKPLGSVRVIDPKMVKK